MVRPAIRAAVQSPCGEPALPVTFAELGGRKEQFVHEISRRVPAGAGKGGALDLSAAELERVLVEGPRALVEQHGVGTQDDLEHTESQGRIDGADPQRVSDRARQRGAPQLGTMGSGNHFVEVQHVRRLHQPRFGLRTDQVTVLVHSGSRGLGHQVCTDFVKRMDAALAAHGIELPDRQLSCAPASSDDGRAYLAAMAAAANFAWANRQAIAHAVREAVRTVLGGDVAAGTRQVYDVAHNVAKVERATAGGSCACTARAPRAPSPARRSSSRARWEPPASCWPVRRERWSRPSAPSATAPGGRCRAPAHASASAAPTCAASSRNRAITVRSPSNKGLAEEAPFAYKDVEAVVDVVTRAGLASPVAQLRPIGVVKG